MTTKLSPRWLAVLACGFLLSPAALADSTPQTLPFSQNWSNTGLITVNDDWTGVPGIEGFRGDNLTAATGTDPQTLLAADDPGVLDVNANQTNPNTSTTGGVSEFDTLADTVVALQGSGTADAPYIRLYLNTTGQSGIAVRYKLRDIDGSADNAVQQVALHYRVGTVGSFTNVPAAYVADATTGGSATQVTDVCVVLPAAVDNQAQVQLRVMTTNAVGNDEWVGIDDIQVDTAGCPPTLSIDDVTQVEGDASTSTFQFTVSLSSAAPGDVTFDITTADDTATVADSDYVANSLTSQTIMAGDTTYTFDVTVNGDTNVEPDETFFVDVSNVAGGGVVVADSHGVGTIVNDDVVLTPIHDIQGAGNGSPVVGNVVTTRGIVTGVRSNGFFIQAPEAEYDADPLTSEGVFVFTSSAPPAAAAVGNQVQVSATVSEYVPTADPLQPPLTELTSPSVSLLATGQPLPTPVALTTTFPDPAVGNIQQLEPLEGMRVSVPSMTVVAPTLGSVNEPNATATSSGVFYGVVTGVARPFRQPGIPANDPPPSCCDGVTIPPVPRFDANPELIRVDADGQTGAALFNVNAGQVVTGLVGPLDYAFRSYSILPDPASPPVVTGTVNPTAVAAPLANEFTVATFNLERFFDDVDDPGIGEPVLTPTAYANRKAKASLAIRDYLRFPDILAVVEVENLTTLQSLAAQISTDAIANSQPDPLYEAFLIEGNDIGGIDTGLLLKRQIVFGATPRISGSTVVQESGATTYTDACTLAPATLHDRPPLRFTGTVNGVSGASFPVTVIAVHNRSLSGANSETACANGTDGNRVRVKRQTQAEDIATLVNTRQVNDPNENIVVLGDFNAYEFNDGLADALNTILGTPTPNNETAVPNDGNDLVATDLTNLSSLAPASERYSFSFDGSAQSLDHVLINAPLSAATSARRVEHPRIDSDFAEVERNNPATPTRISDHDPVVAYFQVIGLPVELESFSIE